MTTVDYLPADVRTRLDKRAETRAACETKRIAGACIYGCRAHARLYKDGLRCDEHAPHPLNPTPDPTRTLAALRTAAAGLREDATFLPSHTILDQRAVASGKRASGERRRAAHDDPPAPSLTDRFRAFHQANPHVHTRLVELVTAEVLRGATRIGVGALFEQLRYAERTETNGDRYALNNDYRADYVRLLVAEHPEWAHLFETRQRRSA